VIQSEVVTTLMPFSSSVQKVSMSGQTAVEVNDVRFQLERNVSDVVGGRHSERCDPDDNRRRRGRPSSGE